MEPIGSTSNAQMKKLRDYMTKKAKRNADGVFVAEGERLVTEAPAEDVLALYLSASFLPGMREETKRFCALVRRPYRVVADEVFARVSDTQTPQGILAVVKQRALSPKELLQACAGRHRPPLFLIPDRLQDPGNLGTILRTAEAAGCDGVILCGDGVDVYHPKVVRATMGSIFRLPVAREKDIGALVRLLRESGIAVAAADMEGASLYGGFDLTLPTAIIIGNEARGLSREALSLADARICIPMAGQVQSLNAAVSAAVLLFEAARQRNLKYGILRR